MREKHGRRTPSLLSLRHEITQSSKYQVLPFSKSFAHFRQCFATAFSSILGKVWNVVFFYLRENETTAGFNGFKTPPSLSLVVVKEDISQES